MEKKGDMHKHHVARTDIKTIYGGETLLRRMSCGEKVMHNLIQVFFNETQYNRRRLYTRAYTHHYERAHTHPIPMSISRRLSRWIES
jgi:hypothetical protein